MVNFNTIQVYTFLSLCQVDKRGKNLVRIAYIGGINRVSIVNSNATSMDSR